MIKELMQSPILLQGISEIASKDDLRVAQDLFDTLIVNKDGSVGMAASMIGVKKRIIAYLDESERVLMHTVMFNPEIIKKNEAYNTGEICLSLLGGSRPRKRYKSIKCQYQTLEIQSRIKIYTGCTVQIIQHGTDHCDGVLI